ncbi:hypothetical protein CRE_22335 [Caenorhabditis remanei]|uniref:Uncharacterized protein n=2 Tax=Caenorhabditis remanei TaxID=31234 RepID=E3ME68_CAERE|nr:hypothetical protein CRE_22335 [Caenorhabditis remanei]
MQAMQTMKDIPPRIFEIWDAPVDIETCGNLITHHKLQCSTCDEKFETEVQFAIHIDKCLQNAERDTHYQIHMHANRLLMFQHRVALFCGASHQDRFLQCGLCKENFENKETIRKHIRICARDNASYGAFIRKTRPLFSNMLSSYEQLGLLFQRYVMDDHIVDIRNRRRSVRLAKADSSPVGRHLFFDEISEHFIEQYRDYVFAICGLIDDAFIRYLKKKESESEAADVIYSLPKKRKRRADGESVDSDSEEDEDDDSEEEIEQPSTSSGRGRKRTTRR